MDQYRAPIDDIVSAMHTVGLDEVLATERFAHLDAHAVRDVLDGFGKLASDVIAPTDRVGDVEGARLDVGTGIVTVPQALAAAHRQYVDGGWQGLASNVDHGGGGFPKAVATAVHEMYGSANLALSLNPMLTQSAIELLEQWGSDAQTATSSSRVSSKVRGVGR